MVGSINRREYAPGQATFVTLTYHRTWPTDPQQQYQHLRAFHKRLQRRWGPLPLIWRKEWQSRGAPHFHLILFAPTEAVVPVGQDWHFADDLVSAWVEIVASEGDNLGHMYRHAVDVKVCDSWKKTMAYAAKHMRYISKDEALLPCDDEGQVLPTGRIWGTLQRDHLPISYETTVITFSEYLQLRRYFRRMKRPDLHRHRYRNIPKRAFTNEHVLMGYGELNRLLAWMGYYRD